MTDIEEATPGYWLAPMAPDIAMMAAGMAFHNQPGRAPIGGGRVTDIYCAMRDAYLTARPEHRPGQDELCERLVAVLAQIDEKVGHFADAPVDQAFPGISVMGEVARLARYGLAECQAREG